VLSGGALMAWALNQQYMRENLKLGPGGETGPVNDLLAAPRKRIGANLWASECSTKASAPGQRGSVHTPVIRSYT